MAFVLIMDVSRACVKKHMGGSMTVNLVCLNLCGLRPA